MMSEKKITEAELAKAFSASENLESKQKPERVKPHKSKKLGISITIFVIGCITLVAGVVFLILTLARKPAVLDGDFLVSTGEWVMIDDSNCESGTNCESNSGVIWKFTEIGKGTLTTNNHINDYDFIWSLEGDKLKIETKWLYDLENEYTYKLNQNEKTLIINDGEKEMVFSGVSRDNMNSDSSAPTVEETE